MYGWDLTYLFSGQKYKCYGLLATLQVYLQAINW